MEQKWYNKKIDEIFDKLKSHENGLTDKAAALRLQKYGPNKLPEPKMDGLAVIFFRQFQSPLIYVLFIASIIVFSMGEIVDGSIILFVLVFNSIVGTFQEGKAQNTLQALKNFVSTNATVLRGGQEDIIPDSEVVVGDIIILQEGEKVPADARIISANNLKIDEAMLTGESKPLEKNSDIILGDSLPISDQKNMVFKGTNVTIGNGKAIITAIGINTEIGKISKEIESIDKEIPLKKNLENLSRIIIYAVVSASILLFLLGMGTGKEFKEMFTTVISLAVSVIPEGLPIVMTLVLAIGVSRMSKRNVLVKKLQAVEALGQVNIIAVDKTGTLTKNEMVVEKLFINDHTYTVQGTGYSPVGIITDENKKVIKGDNEEVLLAAKIAAFCSNARLAFLEKTKEWHVAGDPTEAALLVFAEKAGIIKDELLQAHPMLRDFPFDYQKKYHAVVHEAGSKKMLVVTGAPEAILSLSSMKEEEKMRLENKFKEFSSNGLRVIGFAYKEISHGEPYDIEKLFFGGFFCLIDALRPEVIGAVNRASASGVKVVMITGDHKITAEAIAKDAGIFKAGDVTITGEELDKMTEEELAYKIQKASVFARVTPEHKLKLIRAFKKNGNTIAMTGDGVNDAPSLVAADVGVSMGKIGTEVAKEASDIVLMDDNFGNIISGLKEGRNMYQSIRRVILYLFSTNLSEMLIITGSVILGMPLPLLAAQIIWMNLVSDSFLDVSLAMEPKERNIAKINFSKPNKEIIDKLMGWRMATMSIPMVIGTLFAFSQFIPEDGGDLTKAWTVTMATLALFHWFNVWSCRSETQSVFRMNWFSNNYIWGALAIVVTLQMFAIYHPLMQKILRTAPLHWHEWLFIASVASSIMISEEVRKYIFNKKGWNGLG